MRTQGRAHDELGAKVGPKVARLVSDSMADHLAKTLHVRARLHAEGLNEFFRGMSREKRANTAALWDLFIVDDELPPELKRALQFISHGQGELSEVMGSLGLGQAVGTSILAAIQNFLAPINQRLVATQPNSLLDPATLAALVQRGWMGEEAAHAEAARGGINSTRFRMLHRLAEGYPGLGEVIELTRRGLLEGGEGAELLERNGIAGELIPKLLSLKREHLTAADAALATLRGIISEAEGTEIAALGGYAAGDFKTLVGNTGEPPGLMQMLEGYRRDFINQAELRKGIRESRVRDEWIPLVEKLRFAPASAADAIDAVVQGHLDTATAEQIAAWNGLRHEDFGWLVENAGSPMSNMQALELFNRGVVDQHRVEEAIREGRTKNKYIPNIMHLRVKLPPVFQTVKMIATGGVTPARGAQVMKSEGYEDDIVSGLVHAATSEQVTKAKGVSVSQIEELYEEQAISEAEALSHLRILGYTHANAMFVLRVADIKRHRKLLDAAIAPIRSRYIARVISDAEAGSLLDKLHVPTAQRDQLLAYWTVDRAAGMKVLTPAQVVAANKAGLIDDTNAEARLRQHGYSHEDAQILLDLEKGRTRPAP